MTPRSAGNPLPDPNPTVVQAHPETAKRRWLHARVESNHAGGTFEDGRLTLRVVRTSFSRQLADPIDIWFEVPADFHAHSDSVAAAAMTLLSTTAFAVTFNFGISEHCVTILRDYYRLREIGPIDPSLEPRRPGRVTALNFSGGLDSAAALMLLDELLPGQYAVVTSAYGDGFAHEARGYEPYQREVTCRTNFREKHLAHGRFNAAVPLLFSDDLDLASLATGHGFSQEPLSIDPLLDDSPPRFRLQEAALLAAGLHELHLMRGLMEPGVVKAVRHLPVDRLEAAFNGSGGPSSSKYKVRGAILRHLLEEEGSDVPTFLDAITFEPANSRVGTSLGGMLNMLYLLKHVGVEPFHEYWRGIDEIDPGWLECLSMDFLAKYNPNYLGLLPEQMRASLLSALGRRGIEPYNERDWRELDAVREFFRSFQAGI